MPSLRKCLAAIGFLALWVPSAKAQVVAFQPTIGVIPDGALLTTVPVATADRRYVRVGVDASFYGFVGFNVVPIPAAVSGGGGRGLGGGLGGLGGGAGGGLGGLGGGGGGAGLAGGAGGAGQAAFGGNFDVGMDGVVYPSRPMQPYGPLAGFGQGNRMPPGSDMLMGQMQGNMQTGQMQRPQRAPAVSRSSKAKRLAENARAKAKATSADRGAGSSAALNAVPTKP
jgi:hypothetical protein